MQRNHRDHRPIVDEPERRSGFTLVEVLVATAITLVLMGSVAAMFGFVSTSVTDSRAVAEMGERLRNVRNLLQHDLQGITAYGTPPLSPDLSRGYLEYIEGPVGPLWRPGGWGAAGAVTAKGVANWDSYPGVPVINTLVESVWDDCDDILMFTTRSTSEPYIGRFYDVYGHWNVISSPTAEVCWFMRGTTLFRRVLLVLPNENVNLLDIGSGTAAGPYYFCDISMHQEGGSLDPHAKSAGAPINPKLYANSLADLTKREHRYGHQPLAWPYDARFWNWPSASAGSGVLSNLSYGMPNILGLPTLQECSSTAFPLPFYGPDIPAYSGTYRSSAQYVQTPWFGYYILPASNAKNASALGKNSNSKFYPYHWDLVGGSANPDPVMMTTDARSLNSFNQTSSAYGSGDGLMNTHYSQNPPRFDDVVLTGVVGFDVKIWDPGAPVFQVNATVGGAMTPASVAPGDPYYYQALAKFYSSAAPTNTNATLGSVGAYVDLNYMLDPKNNTTAVALTNYYTHYLTALDNYEANTSVRITTAVSGLTAYPGNIIPRPRFATEGDMPIATGGGSYGVYGPQFAYPGCPPIMRGLPGATASGTILSAYGGQTASVYDTWSTHYESDGIDQDQDKTIDEGTDGIDNPWVGTFTAATFPTTGPCYHPPVTSLNTTSFNYIGGVDDPSELEAPPPYATACKGLQIRIRVIEPGSRQIREVTVTQDLLEE